VDCTNVARDTDTCQAVLHVAMNLLVAQTAGNFLTSWQSEGFSGTTMLHAVTWLFGWFRTYSKRRKLRVLTASSNKPQISKTVRPMFWQCCCWRLKSKKAILNMKTLLSFKTYLYQSTRYNVPEDVNPICTYVGTGKNGESSYQNNRSLSEIQERYHPINSSRIDHGLCVHRRWPMSICSIRVLATTVWYGYCPWSSERSGTLTSLPTSNDIKKPNRRFSLTWSLQIS
jgi:hypothetical protein